MSEQNLNQDEILKIASQKLGVDSKTIKNAAKSEKREQLLKNLSDSDKQKVSKVLNDPELTKKLLSSPQAQSLLKNFFGDK